ncbi:hypothetical protein AN191_14100 [Loktanella sp. 5RATIMAR09]|uniref:hypothetical protein n=1 Tax=Loktanella sp. 5RATIMAR09 TaxID=1225655 RepID=UPI0006EB3B19|nr:hypothetical protein [Loktanella sp. 5RATIMAR09]KQI71106.1 hypothetical protein AN191_14100 [Loktanella sp. 5RATIMAR09]
MAIVTLPRETSERLHQRIEALGQTHPVELFPASKIVMGIVFTTAETKEFGGEGGEAMVLAVQDMAVLSAAIPEFEDERRNYCVINHAKAIARLDPFA